MLLNAIQSFLTYCKTLFVSLYFYILDYYFLLLFLLERSTFSISVMQLSRIYCCLCIGQFFFSLCFLLIALPLLSLFLHSSIIFYFDSLYFCLFYFRFLSKREKEKEGK